MRRQGVCKSGLTGRQTSWGPFTNIKQLSTQHLLYRSERRLAYRKTIELAMAAAKNQRCGADNNAAINDQQDLLTRFAKTFNPSGRDGIQH